MARPVFYKGVPYGNLLAANQVTIPGSLQAVNNYRRNQDANQGAAMLSVGTGIRRQYMDASQNPYHQALATDVYNVNLGDGDDLMAPGSANPTPTASSGWMNVLNTFVGNVSKGIAAKIGGYNPNVPMQIPGTQSMVPSWAPLALAGVGGLVLLNYLRKKA